MEPYRYMAKVAVMLDHLENRNEINRIIDELEFLFEVVEPEFQSQVSDLIARLTARLNSLPDA